MANRVMETRASRIWLGEDGILRIVNRPNAIVTESDILENVAKVEDLMQGERAPILIDLRRTRYIERQARQRLSKLDRSLADAVLIDSPVSTMIGNFFMGLNKLSVPTRLFTSEEKALDWLRGFLNA